MFSRRFNKKKVPTSLLKYINDIFMINVLNFFDLQFVE